MRSLLFNGRGVKSAKDRLACLTVFLLISCFAFAQSTSPVPWIATPLVPGVVTPGSPSFTLTVNGANFVSGSVVYWNGSSLPTTFVSGSQLFAQIPASDVATATSGSVTVHNPSAPASNAAVLLVTTAVAAPSFGSSEISQQYYRPGMMVGDINGDGFVDIAINGNQYIGIVLGNGDGSFQPAVNYAIPGSTYAGFGEAMGDFNNDGTLDVAVDCFTPCKNVDVFLSNPDGTLQLPIQELFNVQYDTAAVGDFNRDGKLDLAVNPYGADFAVGLGILQGNGDGTFSAPISLNVPNNGAFSVAVGDFNRDGILDIAVGNDPEIGGSPAILIYFGNGDGAFASSVSYPLGTGAMLIAVGDLNGDGYADLVWIDRNLINTFWVMLNKGDGTFAAPVEYNGPNQNSEFASLALGDFNGDGKLDVAVRDVECTGGCIEIFNGNGDGTLQPPNVYGFRLNSNGFYSGQMEVGDFNHDGRLDIATPTGNAPVAMIQTSGPAPTITPGSLNFGSEAVGSQGQPLSILLYQSGNTTISIDSVSTTGDFQIYYFAQCVLIPETIQPCGALLSFRPTQAGTRTGTLQINSSGGTQYASLVGVGITGTVGVTVAPTSISYATQVVKTLSAYQSVVITNTGTGTLNLTSISLTGAAAGDFVLVNEDCGASIAPGANCFVEIGFKPTVRGVRSAALSIVDNASNSPQTVPLTGVGSSDSLSASSLSFGSVAVETSSSLTVSLTNAGGNPISISQTGIVGLDKQDYSEINTCGTSLPPQRSCTFTVTFTPTTKGPRKASLAFTSNGTGKNAVTTVPLSGTGM